VLRGAEAGLLSDVIGVDGDFIYIGGADGPSAFTHPKLIWIAFQVLLVICVEPGATSVR